MSAPAIAAPRGGLLDLALSTDHKRIAARIMAAALVFFLGGGVMALVMRLELAQPGLQVVSTDSYNALFTMHGSTMIYLVVAPLALALGVFMVPLQVGAPRIAMPRLALTGFWLFLIGGVVMESGFLTAGGPGRATWIGVAPLSDMVNTPGIGMDLWIFGVALATAGELALGVCVLATALGLRTEGMTLLRMPVFSWTMVATTLMVCFAFPVLIVALGLLWVQRQYGGIFTGQGGAVAWQHLFWFYGHPVVYVMFFPFVGAVAEVFATFSGRRFFGYRMFVGSILLFAALSMSVWGHHMFTTGAVDNKYFSLTTTAILVPAGVEYFDLLGTLWGGRIRYSTALLFGVVFLLQFLVGGLTGIWVASAPLDYHANNSYFVVAHFHYTLFAGSVFALFAAVYYWFPRWTGALLREGLGKLQLALMVVGTNLTFAPMFALGQEGMTRRVADYRPHSDWETLNTLATIGSFVIALGVVVFLVNLAVSLRARREAGPDPWEGQTLEWATTPVPVRSYAPLWDLRHGEA